MVHNRLMRRVSALVLGGIACLFLGAVALVVYEARWGAARNISDRVGSAVQLSPGGDLASSGAPLRLSDVPSLVLSRGVIAVRGTESDTHGTQGLILERARFVLDANAMVREPWSSGEARAPTAADLIGPLFDQLKSFGFETLVLRDAEIDILWGRRTERLTSVNAEITRGRRQTGTRTEPIAAKGAFMFRGRPLSFETVLGAPSDNHRRAENPLSFNVKGELVSAQFDGKIILDRALAMTGPLEASTSKAVDFARWLGLEGMPQHVGTTAQLKADVEWRNGVLALHSLSGRFDGQPMTGRMALNHWAERSKLEGTLAFGAIDLTSSVAAALANRDEIMALDQSWPSISTTASLMRDMDFDIRLSAARPTLRGELLKPLALTVIATNGRMQADLPAFDVHGTRGSIQVTIDTAHQPAPKTAIRSRFETSEAAQFARSLFGTDVVAGRTSVLVDLAGTGPTIGNVLQSAIGRVHVTGVGPLRLSGDVRGLRVEALKGSSPLPQAPDTKTRPAENGWGVVQRRPSTLERVEIRSTLNAGSLTIDSGRFEQNGQPMSVSGQIGLLNQTLSLLLGPQVRVAADAKSTVQGSLTPLSDRGSETDPISIQGSWANPAIRLHRPQSRN